MTEFPKRRPSDWSLIGKCDSCGTAGVELYHRGNEELCDSCYVFDADNDKGKEVQKAVDKHLDFFRKTFTSATRGEAE